MIDQMGNEKSDRSREDSRFAWNILVDDGDIYWDEKYGRRSIFIFWWGVSAGERKDDELQIEHVEFEGLEDS